LIDKKTVLTGRRRRRDVTGTRREKNLPIKKIGTRFCHTLTRAARFFLLQHAGIGGKIYQMTTNVTNGHKVYKLCKEIYKITIQNVFKGPQKFTIWQS
jgi:hypothetical protein